MSETKINAASIEAFIKSRNVSKNSQKTYRNALNQLMKFFADNEIDLPNKESLNSFIEKLWKEKKSIETLRMYTSAFKLYFAWLERKGLYQNCAAEIPNVRKNRTRKVYPLSEILHFVEGDSLRARRDRAIIALALSADLKPCEIEQADICDLRRAQSGDFLVVRGNQVRIAPDVYKLIERYLNLRGKFELNDPLFVSTSRNVSKFGSRLSAQSVCKLIRSMIKKSELQH